MSNELSCQCEECQITPHQSDCAVHNMPALPKGDCDCGVLNVSIGYCNRHGDYDPETDLYCPGCLFQEEQEVTGKMPCGHPDSALVEGRCVVCEAEGEAK